MKCVEFGAVEAELNDADCYIFSSPSPSALSLPGIFRLLVALAQHALDGVLAGGRVRALSHGAREPHQLG